MKKTWPIENLDCPNCASKLERALSSLEYVDAANVNFVNKTVSITAKDEVFAEVCQAVLAETARVEPEARIIIEEHGRHHGDARPMVLYRVGAAAVLLAVGLLVKGWLGVALLVLAYLAVGYDILLAAVRNIGRGQIFDENFLMAVASLGAMLMGEYAEGIAVLALYQVGEWFQDRAVDKSRASIAALMDIRPDYANLLENGQAVKVAPETVQVGQTILIRPGEKVPLDGVVVEGSSSLNTVALTGESLPRDVAEGDKVVSGSVNLSGLLTVQVTSAYGESTVAKILQLVEASGENKAKAEKFITRFARVYTPLVCLAAVLLAVIPSLFDGQWMMWLRRALTFLVISCPCALVISVPLTFFSGIGGASRKGILIKGANYMEALAGLKAVVFDKTGTLTQGSFSVTAVKPQGVAEAELLEMAALAESHSSHPIGKPVIAAYGKAVDHSRVTDMTEIAGQGLSALVDGRTVHVGNAKLMTGQGLTVDAAQETGTLVHVAVDGSYWGHLVIDDEVKPTAAAAVQGLKENGVFRLVMLTGDRQAVAQRIADQLGLTEVHAELLPEDKVHRLEALLGNGPVAFVGDGINDAPVLRRADVGIAMGGMGSDAAIEAADVVLMDDDPAKLPRAIGIARKTMGIVRQNIAFALGIKLAVMLLGALGVANMWIAVFADVGVAMLAILNAMRAMK